MGAQPIHERFGGGDYLRSKPSDAGDDATRLVWEPLFDSETLRAAVADAVLRERKRCAERMDSLAEEQRRCYVASQDRTHLEKASAHEWAARVLREGK